MKTPLYEDNHLLVVEKPVNMPVQGDISGDRDLLTALKGYVKEKYAKPGEAYLGLVHRLDRPVGGVMVFARTSKAASRLTKQFASREAKKRYVAIVRGDPLPEALLTDYLVKDEAANTTHVCAEGTPGAKKAMLQYALLGKSGDTALLDITLYTGRPHQIRVQLAHAGLPILGDQKYNPSPVPGEQIKLFSYALTLRHPTLGEEMTFFATPKGPGWEAFGPQIALLPALRTCRGVGLDDGLLVVDKNAAVEVETDLVNDLATLFPGVRPVHRLDANTLGLTALALDESTEERLKALFYNHAVRKTYHALVKGRPRDTESLIHYITKDADAATVHICPSDAPGALRCELGLRVLQSGGETSLVEIDLRTGRTHQIRAQLAAIGCPVLGDDKYGDRELNRACRARTQRLLCKRLTIEGKTYESLRELTL